MLSIAINVLLVIHVLVSLLIILLVLMQRPKNEGLGAAFGGGMTENLFGAQTTNVLQTLTRYLGAIFFGLTVVLSWLYVKETHAKGGSVQQRLLAVPPPAAATPAPAAGTPAPVATPAAGEKKLETATPVPAPTAATPAPATPIPATPASEAAKPPTATPAPNPASAAPATPAPAAAPTSEKPAAPSGDNKPAEPAKTPEKPGN